ncbi:Tubulin epsilon chain [Perkinsus olseni]|uniref:Tubulin epsilon chain n=1 Tax=Perkinsus olseni TaxID=32597 RepID=A0A7J6MA44_PEROL|nr:Tubulin epsilon chain [Perkinsus olseni]
MSRTTNYPSSAVPSAGLHSRPKLIPLPGVAMKTTCTLHQRPNTSTKMFVNICGHPLVEGPLLPSGARADGHLVDKMGIRNMQVPVDVGSFRKVFDRAGNACVAIDVIFAPWLVSKLADCVPIIQRGGKMETTRQSLVVDLVTVALRNVQNYAKPVKEVNSRGWKFLKASYKFLDEQTNTPVEFEPADEQDDVEEVKEASAAEQVAGAREAKLIEVVADNGAAIRRSRGVLKPGFLTNTKGVLYGESGSTEGVIPENAGDPMGWLPKKLRQSCKIVDTASAQQKTSSGLPAEQQKMQREIEQIFDKHSYNSLWADDVPQKSPEEKDEPRVSMETKDGQLICIITPADQQADASRFDIELCANRIRVDGRELPIPATVQESRAQAKFSKKRNRVTITAPLASSNEVMPPALGTCIVGEIPLKLCTPLAKLLYAYLKPCLVKFWDLVIREHSAEARRRQAQGRAIMYDDCISTFFRNLDANGSDIPTGSDSPLENMRARAILVDMEQGVINQVLNSKIGSLFRDPKRPNDCRQQQCVTDVSGAGNNWAHGYFGYGATYGDSVMEKVRYAVEACDSLQAFFCVNSLGGGTGSGLGSYILERLEDEYGSKAYRFVSALFPTIDAEDDVITSPYNAILSLTKLRENASCVLPISNDALARIVNTYNASAAMVSGGPQKGGGGMFSSKQTTFDDMNSIVARCWLDLTASMRFEGSLNVDLNEITSNLVPFPNTHFLLPALSPIFQRSKDVRLQPRSFDHMFTDAFSPGSQLVGSGAGVDPRASLSLASAFLLRGECSLNDVNRNVTRIKKTLNRPAYLDDCYKIGICNVLPTAISATAGRNSNTAYPYSLLSLVNSCAIRPVFEKMHANFWRLYKRKAHVHHYTEYMDQGVFEEARQTLRAMMDDYTEGKYTESLARTTAIEKTTLSGIRKEFAFGRLLPRMLV